VPADRAAYEARQAELLASLLRGGDYPAGFAPQAADAAGRALRAKRARAVADAWPAVAAELGEEFAGRFDAYARGTAGPPAAGGAIADGQAFVASLADPPSDAVRVELLFARAVIGRGRRRPRPRRGPFVGAIWLRDPRRLLVLARLPGRDPRCLVVPVSPLKNS
jgi:hypothetical protein